MIGKIVLVVILAVCGKYYLKTFTMWGGYTHKYMHYPGLCRVIEGIQPGSEDFQVLSTGQTFITSGLRTISLNSNCQDFWRRNNVKGRIYLLDFKNVTAGVKEIKVASTSHFNANSFSPHGLSVLEDKKTGRHVVFVVNHPYETDAVDRVEKFVYDPKTEELVHQTYFSDPALMLTNDIVATGENSFYITNSRYFRLWPLVVVETMLALPLTNVLHYDGQTYTVVDSGLASPNGIGLSPDKEHLYVASTLSQELLVYKRKKDNSLERVQTFPLHAFPDNIAVDERTGDLTVALHPIGYQFMAYLNDIGTLQSPSQVVHLHVKDGLITAAQELLYDDGELISAASVAMVKNGVLLAGSFSHNLITCQVNVPLL